MSNMSYCRFENTIQDMQDCIEALGNSCHDLEAMMKSASSREEARAMKQFITMCREVTEDFEFYDENDLDPDDVWEKGAYRDEDDEDEDTLEESEA